MTMPRKLTESRKGIAAYIGAMLTHRDRLIRQQKPRCRTTINGVPCVKVKL